MVAELESGAQGGPALGAIATARPKRRRERSSAYGGTVQPLRTARASGSLLGPPTVTRRAGVAVREARFSDLALDRPRRATAGLT